MSFDPPRLDDADGAALMAAARAALVRRGAGWQADDAADPGVALLEAFAHITAEELIRLNRLPEAAHLGFLSMLGAQLRPGVAAATSLSFTVPAKRRSGTKVPAGIRVAAAQAPDMIFTTLEDAVIPAGELEVRVTAAQVGRIVDEIAGHGSNAPGQRLQLPHRPLPGAPGLAAEVRVLVAAGEQGAPAGCEVVDRGGELFIAYEEISHLGDDDRGALFEIDRVGGVITFPKAGPYIPATGASIRVRYNWTESGPLMSLPAGSLTEVVGSLPGLSVTNLDAVEAGLMPETTEEARRRGVIGRFTSGSAVRARDYEALALQAHPAIARAHATALSERWMFAQPGSVQVLVAPVVTPGPAGAVGPDVIETMTAPKKAGQEALQAVVARLEAARGLGVSLSVDWIKMRAVGIGARIYVATGADKAAIMEAVVSRLNGLLSPLPGPVWPDGWPLGRALRNSEVIETIASTTGVRAADRVVLRPRDPMSGAVAGLQADCAQPGTWYAAVGGCLYRTLDDGDGWVLALGEGSNVTAVAAHPVRTGLVAASTDDGMVHYSADCGQTFEPFATFSVAPEQMLWADGAEVPRLLLAGAADLAEASGPGENLKPRQVERLLASDAAVGPAYVMASYGDHRGGRLVAVARRALGGIVLSNDSGWDGGFEPVGLGGVDVRALTFFEQEETVWLVAGCAQPVVAGAHVCYAARVDLDMGTVGEWYPADAGWSSNGIISLAARNGRIYAATSSDGLMVGYVETDRVKWVLPGQESGLPPGASGRGRAAIYNIALAPDRPEVMMIGGDGLILISRDGGTRFEDITLRHGAERVAIPVDWTICADEHLIEVYDDTG